MLRTIHFCQAVFVSPGAICGLIMNIPSLQRLALEDAYLGGIWEARLRFADVADTLKHLDERDPRRERIVQVLECTVRLERIVGGDRG